jgi:hypothetical protein
VSFRAILWALKQRPKKGADKHVLIELADYVSKDGNTCYPSQSTLAEAACVSEDSIGRSISRLKSEGLIRVERRKGADGKHMRSVYHLNISDTADVPPNKTAHDDHTADCGMEKRGHTAHWPAPDRDTRN